MSKRTRWTSIGGDPIKSSSSAVPSKLRLRISRHHSLELKYLREIGSQFVSVKQIVGIPKGTEGNTPFCKGHGGLDTAGGGFSPSFASPTTSESNNFSVSGCQMNSIEIVHNSHHLESYLSDIGIIQHLHHSDSDRTDIFSANTSTSSSIAGIGEGESQKDNKRGKIQEKKRKGQLTNLVLDGYCRKSQPTWTEQMDIAGESVMNDFGMVHNLHNSESDLTDIFSANTSTTSSPIVGEFSLDHFELDPNFPFNNPIFFS
ncbi:hypothetical protein RND71_019060 [Anisodus tanguticus]|uniref:Uncharacterized protein n=1 Tax=Anisodus tanguticus TaxID=243964 RepID=A0AAE1VK08_9SOLA|nr:hypothetical protein RND71_019060 [Anisodus tanguticus]